MPDTQKKVLPALCYGYQIGVAEEGDARLAPSSTHTHTHTQEEVELLAAFWLDDSLKSDFGEKSLGTAVSE